jgi:predicted nucleic acid-binding protein
VSSVVVDASVAIKWILPEHDTDLAEALIGR